MSKDTQRIFDESRDPRCSWNRLINGYWIQYSYGGHSCIMAWAMGMIQPPSARVATSTLVGWSRAAVCICRARPRPEISWNGEEISCAYSWDWFNLHRRRQCLTGWSECWLHIIILASGRLSVVSCVSGKQLYNVLQTHYPNQFHCSFVSYHSSVSASVVRGKNSEGPCMTMPSRVHSGR